MKKNKLFLNVKNFFFKFLQCLFTVKDIDPHMLASGDTWLICRRTGDLTLTEQCDQQSGDNGFSNLHETGFLTFNGDDAVTQKCLFQLSTSEILI